MKHETTYNYVEILNPTTGHTLIAADHSDTHFFNGYTQLVRYVPNHEVDIFLQDAIAEEEHLQAMANSATDNVQDTQQFKGNDSFNASDSYFTRESKIY